MEEREWRDRLSRDASSGSSADCPCRFLRSLGDRVARLATNVAILTDLEGPRAERDEPGSPPLQHSLFSSRFSLPASPACAIFSAMNRVDRLMAMVVHLQG